MLDLWLLYPAHRARSFGYLTVSLCFLTLGLSLAQLVGSLATVLYSTGDITSSCSNRCLATVIHSLHTRGQLGATSLISLAVSVHGFTDRPGKGTHTIAFTICHSARRSSVCLLVSLRASFKTWRL